MMCFKENKYTIAEAESPALSIRQAEYKDIEILVEICRKSFTKLVRWQIPRFLSRKRWEYILSSDVAETWVCSANNQLAGYVTLVRDIAAFKLEKHQYDRFFFKKLYCYLLCPRLFLRMLIRKMYIFTSRPSQPESVRQNGPDLINCAWVDSIAVDPEMRRKGIAKKLLYLCKKRALQLNLAGMKLAVDSDNTEARNLYKNFGFHCISHSNDTEIYVIELTNDGL
jgi:GNAT superfamily N-acetyltransferase